MLLLIGALYVFAMQRNSQRLVQGPEISFSGDNNLFITHATVSKLLIQNQNKHSEQPKEMIDLNALESALKSNPHIKQAEVALSVDGKLSAQIKQRRPIARVQAQSAYYLDDEGQPMPLSLNYTARVPVVSGYVNKDSLYEVFKVAKMIDGDSFLKQHVIAINIQEDQTIAFRIRTYDMTVQLGDATQLYKKINNFKAFYQKALKDSILNSYSIVNLKFDKQVICTKK